MDKLLSSFYPKTKKVPPQEPRSIKYLTMSYKKKQLKSNSCSNYNKQQQQPFYSFCNQNQTQDQANAQSTSQQTNFQQIKSKTIKIAPYLKQMKEQSSNNDNTNDFFSITSIQFNAPFTKFVLEAYNKITNVNECNKAAAKLICQHQLREYFEQYSKFQSKKQSITTAGETMKYSKLINNTESTNSITPQKTQVSFFSNSRPANQLSELRRSQTPNYVRQVQTSIKKQFTNQNLNKTSTSFHENNEKLFQDEQEQLLYQHYIKRRNAKLKESNYKQQLKSIVQTQVDNTAQQHEKKRPPSSCFPFIKTEINIPNTEDNCLNSICNCNKCSNNENQGQNNNIFINKNVIQENNLDINNNIKKDEQCTACQNQEDIGKKFLRDAQFNQHLGDKIQEFMQLNSYSVKNKQGLKQNKRSLSTVKKRAAMFSPIHNRKMLMTVMHNYNQDIINFNKENSSTLESQDAQVRLKSEHSLSFLNLDEQIKQQKQLQYNRLRAPIIKTKYLAENQKEVYNKNSSISYYLNKYEEKEHEIFLKDNK